MDTPFHSRFREQQAAIAIATKVIAWPAVIAWLTGMVLIGILFRIEMSVPVIVGLIWLGSASAPFVQVAGEITGWMAFRLFENSIVSVRTMAIAMALIVDFSAFGWIFVLIQIHTPSLWW